MVTRLRVSPAGSASAAIPLRWQPRSRSELGISQQLPAAVDLPWHRAVQAAASVPPLTPSGHFSWRCMGTSLNARSSGLAAKMSSPRDMDISPAPVAPLVSHFRPSPSEALPKLMDNIHVGAHVEAGSSKDRLHLFLEACLVPGPSLSASLLQLADSMSSRLFGAEIAFNSQSIFARDQELLSSPDKEHRRSVDPSRCQQGRARPTNASLSFPLPSWASHLQGHDLRSLPPSPIATRALEPPPHLPSQPQALLSETVSLTRD